MLGGRGGWLLFAAIRRLEHGRSYLLQGLDPAVQTHQGLLRDPGNPLPVLARGTLAQANVRRALLMCQHRHGRSHAFFFCPRSAAASPARPWCLKWLPPPLFCLFLSCSFSLHLSPRRRSSPLPSLRLSLLPSITSLSLSLDAPLSLPSPPIAGCSHQCGAGPTARWRRTVPSQRLACAWCPPPPWTQGF